MADSWEGVYEDDTHMKKPVDEHVQKTLTFVQEHEVILRTIEEATRNAIAEAPETHYRAIRMVTDTPEKVLPQDLIDTDNELLRKVISVLVFLCDEVNDLVDIAENKLYRPLQMFGQTPSTAGGSGDGDRALDDDDDSFKPGEREKMIGHFLPLLQDTSNFIDRCYTVATNLVQQMASILKPKEQLYRSAFKETHMSTAFISLGQLLTILITLDNIIDSNDTIKECWGYYKTMISFIRNDPAQFNTNDEALAKFEKMLVSVDQTVLISEIFKGCVEQNYETYQEDEEEIYVNVRSNELFFQEMLYCLKTQLDDAMKVVGTGAEMFERKDMVSSLALYVLYRKLLPANKQPDPKMHKYLWESQKVIPVVILADSVMFTPGEFINAYAFFEIKKPDPVNPAQYRRQYIATFDSQIADKTSTLLSQSQAWLVLAESRIQPCLRHEKNVDQVLDVRASILLKGLSLANRASALAKQALVIHSCMQVPLSKGSLLNISRLVEVLKIIEFTLMRKDTTIAEYTVHMLRVLYDAVHQSIQGVLHKLQATRQMDNAAVDTHQCVKILEGLVKSSDSLSPTRRYALQIMSQIVSKSSYMTPKDATRLEQLVKRLVAISSFQTNIRFVCDTSFLYFHQDILRPIVTALYLLPTEVNRLQYIIAAFADSIRMCAAISHCEPTPFFVGFRSYLKEVMTDCIIQPLCRDIENNLRVHISTKNLAHLDTVNPKSSNLTPLRPFLDMSPLRVLGLIIDIHQEVKHYLDTNFYNLTTISLHDWRTYADMRSLAAEKLGLDLMDNLLPMGSDDSGLDVLQIMRNIHIFVSRFTYNMNMQQFVEYRPDKSSKHLNTIRIQSIAASIRQHGLGVLNTTVNYTYQFLAQKFHIYSQFLFDDYIGAHLGREHRWFKKHRHDSEISNMYPYDRALKFVKEIRKLGVSSAGKSFLDQFRILITEIGNALGYVRMVRSASMFYCSEAVQYLPDFEDVINFEKHTGKGEAAADASEPDIDAEGNPVPGTGSVGGPGITGAGLSDETVRSAKNLDEVIDTLVKNFGEGSDYFKVLVNVFQKVLLTKEHDHLKNFYLIVPALCISWVEASLTAKDCMYKATRGVVREMYYTDDGFPVGVAYCLAILKQTRKFEALHWVDTVRTKHKEDAKDIAEQQAMRDARDKVKAAKKEAAEKSKKGMFGGLFGGKKKATTEEDDDDEDFEEQEANYTLQVSAKRLEAQRRETEQLFYCLSGAGIFFKRTDVDTD